ncbi:MAG: hypothetical protein QOE57_2072, partial [Acidimicrobiaceae bacterium]|nr:hypothetical protein [Acidimicrobiaceae bacterium]
MIGVGRPGFGGANARWGVGLLQENPRVGAGGQGPVGLPVRGSTPALTSVAST